MIDIKELRDRAATLGSDYLTDEEWIEVIDRLEAAESARRDDYQNWMTALDRNAELLAKLEAAEKERDKYKTAYNEWCEKLEWIQEGINNREISPKYLGPHLADIALDLLKEHKEMCYDLQAKVEQMGRPSVPAGWKLMPIEPTEKMVNEGSCASTLPGPRYISEECAKQCWEYMIKASPNERSESPEAKP